MDRFRVDRSVVLMGGIDMESMERVIAKINEIYEKDREEWITLFITSGGGNIVAAFAFYDYITSVLRPKLQTVVLGYTASMALLVFLAGEYRLIDPHTSLFFHELKRVQDKEDKFTRVDLERICSDIKVDMGYFTKIMETRTNEKTSVEMAEEMMRSEMTLYAQQAFEKGFAHEILE
ncbi:ATP-dependent Clp protease proteolytic subunit [Patescibacteria group bacterium]|nr:ATP-dependent Clp protease proteolytic subunit [Patescibacteria group bacterium]